MAASLFRNCILWNTKIGPDVMEKSLRRPLQLPRPEPSALRQHGIEETEIFGKPARGTFVVSFFLACLAVQELGRFKLVEM
jgi:hypothetical protein